MRTAHLHTFTALMASAAIALAGESITGQGAGMVLAQAPQAQSPQAQPTPQQRAAMLRQWMQASQAQLRAYEWIETTVVTKGGEEKSRKALLLRGGWRVAEGRGAGQFGG